MANLITRSISMPEEIFGEIDNVAEGWYTNRSQAFIRIYQEWKQLKRQQAPAPTLPTPAPVAEAEAAEVTR
jgi:metal-responsive CopG/Arc/MetJ family transcriptional regulator